jgi:hypothetical protein
MDEMDTMDEMDLQTRCILKNGEKRPDKPVLLVNISRYMFT